MTVELIELIATQGVFRPRQRFIELAADHVPFDSLLGQQQFEALALQAVANDEPVGIVGPRGAGKSSLIAHVCDNLPSGYVALRVPVTGADEPDNVSVVAAVALSQALSDLELEREQREALSSARADQQSQQPKPGGLRSGTLGGGPVPVAVHAELVTLQQQLTTNRLATERLAGLDRLISILVARGVQPLFVLEDTEAAIGGAERPELAAAFLAGPVRAFAIELQTPCIVAIQNVFTESSEFPQVAAGMRILEIPILGDNVAHQALDAIIVNRLEQYDAGSDPRAVIGDDVLEQLITFYDETGRSLRFTLAALQAAAEYAAEMRAERIAAGHVRAAVIDWRGRIAT